MIGWNPEQAGLCSFHQEQRLVAGLRGHRDGQYALENIGFDLFPASAQTDLDVR